jgi:hypothetical protein
MAQTLSRYVAEVSVPDGSDGGFWVSFVKNKIEMLLKETCEEIHDKLVHYYYMEGKDEEDAIKSILVLEARMEEDNLLIYMERWKMNMIRQMADKLYKAKNKDAKTYHAVNLKALASVRPFIGSEYKAIKCTLDDVVKAEQANSLSANNISYVKKDL